MSWIVVPNWEKFQHRSDRSLPWLKLYIELEGRDDWRQLSLADRGLLVCIWIEYRRSKGQLRALDIGNRVGLAPHYAHVSRHLKALSDAGFIQLSATQPKQLVDAPDQTKTKTPKSPVAKPHKPKVKTTGWRIVRGSHGMTTIPDPDGTDPAPTIGRPL